MKPITPLRNSGRTFSWPIALLFLTALLLLIYTITRAACTELTIDEIHSWEKYANKFQVYPAHYDFWSANHHWLNSWLMQFCGWLFGEHPVSLRLPNLVAHAAYLYFTARMILLLRRDLFAVAAFILLNAHPYLLDFFSLARGYGLSLGSLAGSIYFLLLFARELKMKDLVLALFFGCLAVISNFVMLNFFFVMLGVLLLLILVAAPRKKIRFIAVLFGISGGLLALVIPHILNLRAANALTFGNSSFWNETISGLSYGILYSAPYAGNNPFASSQLTIIVLVSFIAIGQLFYFYREKKISWLRSVHGICFLLFAGTITFMILQNILLKTPYPPGRSSVYLFVLFLTALLFSLENLKSRIAFPVLAALCIPVLFHFFARSNFEGVYEWREASGTRDALNRIIAAEKGNSDTVTIVTGNISGASMTYLARQANFNRLNIVRCPADVQPPHADYYFIEKWITGYDTTQWALLKHYEFWGNHLYTNKQQVTEE